MTNVANLLKNSNKSELLNLLSGLYGDVLVGDNETVDAQLFLALEQGDFAKAKEIYETAFRPYLKSVANQKAAA